MDVRRILFWRKPKQLQSDIRDYAQRELELAGLFSEDSDYGGMIGEAVMELVEVFVKQGHSGFSAGMTLHLFRKVASFEPITPLTFEPEEWNHVHEDTYQHRRKPSVFSDDGLKHWYDLDEEPRRYHPIEASA